MTMEYQFVLVHTDVTQPSLSRAILQADGSEVTFTSTEMPSYPNLFMYVRFMPDNTGKLFVYGDNSEDYSYESGTQNVNDYSLLHELAWAYFTIANGC